MPQTAVHFNSDQFVKDMSDLGMDQQQVAVLSNAFTILHSEHVTREDLVDVKNEVTQVKEEIVSLKSETAADFKFLSRQYDTQLIKIDAIEKVVIGKIEGVQKEIGGLRNEMNIKIDSLEGKIDGVQKEMSIKIDSVQKEIGGLRNEMKTELTIQEERFSKQIAIASFTIIVSMSAIMGAFEWLR